MLCAATDVSVKPSLNLVSSLHCRFYCIRCFHFAYTTAVFAVDILATSFAASSGRRIRDLCTALAYTNLKLTTAWPHVSCGVAQSLHLLLHIYRTHCPPFSQLIHVAPATAISKHTRFLRFGRTAARYARGIGIGVPSVHQTAWTQGRLMPTRSQRMTPCEDCSPSARTPWREDPCVNAPPCVGRYPVVLEVARL